MFSLHDLSSEELVAAFVTKFIAADAQARELLNPSNRRLFADGYRPQIGIPHDPEIEREKFSDILSYFIRKLYFDMKSISPFDQQNFQTFVDQIGYWSEKTLLCAGDIATKYNLNLSGGFVFTQEIKKITSDEEREQFKTCWMNDFILGTELRMLAWIHWQLFGLQYINPEKR
ncbi:MAG: hypothetical protein WD673_10790 [Alphaproteobacteria bacterium]